jgi:hypothetical protein
LLELLGGVLGHAGRLRQPPGLEGRALGEQQLRPLGQAMVNDRLVACLMLPAVER